MAVLAVGGTTSDPDSKLTKNTVWLAFAEAVAPTVDALETVAPAPELPLALEVASVPLVDVPVLVIVVLITDPLGGN